MKPYLLPLGILSWVLQIQFVSGQSEFDRPDFIQTSYSRALQASQQLPDRSVNDNRLRSDETPSNQLPGYSQAGCTPLSQCVEPPSMRVYGYSEYGDEMAYGYSGDFCECEDFAVEDSCCQPPAKRFGFSMSGIVDIPLDGVFVTGDDSQTTAGAFSVPAAIWAAGTPLNLIFYEQGFEDVYDTFGGVDANLSMNAGCGSAWFLGYRYLTGRADYINIGNAVINPDTSPQSYPVFAQFSEFTESRIQAGYTGSRCLRKNLEMLWIGRVGIGFVDGIDARFDVPGLSVSNNYRIYDSTTNLSFGINSGFRINFGCHLSAQLLSGLEYRTSLNEWDAQLANIGLQELNDGSGFASLPVYCGFTYYR